MTDTDPQPELSDNEQRLLAALLATPTVKAAAKKAGISERCAHDYIVKPTFKAAQRKARAVIFDQHLNALAELLGEAIKTLKRGMKCKKPAVEVRAAIAVANLALDGAAMGDLLAEVAELRALLAEKEPALPGAKIEPTALPAAESETESSAPSADALNL